MKLDVHVLGRAAATLEPLGDFKSVLTYRPEVSADDFVSLTMPVRTESYVWDDPLHPIFQMNLPEGYLLQILQEQLGPHVGASPTALLSVVGRNMIGRIQVAAPGANLAEPPEPFEVEEVLRGDNSEAAFAELVRRHARSGVSGVLPKFLDASKQSPSAHRKATLFTRRHIIKGASPRLPFVALVEHLAMQVAAQVTAAARTEVSDDGQVLVVHRFDVDAKGQPFRGFEDFCALLGLRPANKYETTWERIARAVRDFVPGDRRRETFEHLAATLLLTYALRNADCHAKNVGLLYSSRADVAAAPIYDMLTTAIYADYQHNPPGISFLGKKTWLPGKNLERFIVATFGVPVAAQKVLVERISDAVADVAPHVRRAMRDHPKFDEHGKRLLAAWKQGVDALRDPRMFALGQWSGGSGFEGLARAPKRSSGRESVGSSPLLAPRRKRKK